MADFSWYTCPGGCCFQDYDVGGKSARLLVPDVLRHYGELVERRPLEEAPGLHRTFASLEPTETVIAKFAAEWGPLRNAYEFCDEPSFDPDEDEGEGPGESGFMWRGEELELWTEQITRMRALVTLWDTLRGGGEKKLSQVIELHKEGDHGSWFVKVTFKACPGLRWDMNFYERQRPGTATLWSVGGPRGLARMCLLDLVNDSLWGSCSPRLRIGDRPTEVTARFVPHNLGAALWLMFAQEILGARAVKQCQQCKHYFEVQGGDDERRQRSDKKYCSSRCRAAAFRERVDKSRNAEF
jgi:hypothetical protein